MKYMSTKDADDLRKLLNDNPGLPLIFMTKPDESMGEAHGIISIDYMEKGKVIAGDDADGDTAITTDEELRLMLAGDVTDEEYMEDPDGYIKNFAENAEKYKKMWKPALLVQMNVVNDEDEDW